FVSSLVGHSAAPFQANYGATKAFIFSIGQALYYEFKEMGIDVTTLSPGLTDTEGVTNEKRVDFNKLPFTKMHTSVVVRSGLNALGKKMLVVPGAKNNFFDFITKYIMPRKMGITLGGKMIAKALS